MTNQFIGRHESFEGTRKELSVNQISLRARIEGRPMRLYYHFISFANAAVTTFSISSKLCHRRRRAEIVGRRRTLSEDTGRRCGIVVHGLSLTAGAEV